MGNACYGCASCDSKVWRAKKQNKENSYIIQSRMK